MSEDKKEKNSINETKAESPKTEVPVKSSEPKIEKKSSKTKKKSTKSGITASELVALAETEASAALARSKTAKEAAEKALEEEYKEAAKEVVKAKVVDSFTNKRLSEQIFRREMGEPEFFLRKHELAPPRPILTQEEEEEISRRVAIPTDQTPKYIPQHMLSPEYQGTSNYEIGISSFRDELEENLSKLQDDPDANPKEIHKAIEDLKTVDNYFENYNLGMNVFRTAHGGRNKLDK
jgi:colicin import membrane protein